VNRWEGRIVDVTNVTDLKSRRHSNCLVIGLSIWSDGVNMFATRLAIVPAHFRKGGQMTGRVSRDGFFET
jgi:hypothetical protein